MLPNRRAHHPQAFVLKNPQKFVHPERDPRKLDRKKAGDTRGTVVKRIVRIVRTLRQCRFFFAIELISLRLGKKREEWTSTAIQQRGHYYARRVGRNRTRKNRFSFSFQSHRFSKVRPRSPKRTTQFLMRRKSRRKVSPLIQQVARNARDSRRTETEAVR